jgi:hypothetical protein
MRRVSDTSCRLGARERIIGARGRLPTDGDGTVARSLPTRQSVRVDSPAERLNWLQHQYVHHGWRSAVLQSVFVSVLLWIVMPFFVEDVSRSIGRLAACLGRRRRLTLDVPLLHPTSAASLS